jgi:hypothetical protein
MYDARCYNSAMDALVSMLDSVSAVLRNGEQPSLAGRVALCRDFIGTQRHGARDSLVARTVGAEIRLIDRELRDAKLTDIAETLEPWTNVIHGLVDLLNVVC